MSRSILIFGAGNIGLSFVGQVFRRAGYRVVFADVDASLCARLARDGGYTVEHLAPDGSRELVAVSPVEVVDARDRGALAAELADRPLVATAVGARAFPHVIAAIRDALREPTACVALDVIAAENIHDPMRRAREAIGAPLPGIHAASVGKMVPLQERAAAGPVAIRAEAFNTLYVDGTDWRGEVPHDVAWIELVDEIAAWMARKLYIHNLGHSTCAWSARAVDPRIETIAEAIDHPAIRMRTRSVMEAAAAIVAARYPDSFDASGLADHIADLLHRFGNRALGDSVERVGRDLARKLGPDERLVGCMRESALRAPGALDELGRIYRTALRFGVAGVAMLDGDLELTRRAAAGEVAAILREVSAVDPASAVGRAVLGAYTEPC